MSEQLSRAKKVAFSSLAVGRYFVWWRSPELGPLMKCDEGSALDMDDREFRLTPDEEVIGA